MKSLSTALPIVLAISCIVCDGAFTPDWLRAFQARPINSRYRRTARQSQEEGQDPSVRKAPHPPKSSPPEQLLRDQMFFATLCDPKDDDECEPDEPEKSVNGVFTEESVEAAAQAARKAGQIFGAVSVSVRKG